MKAEGDNKDNQKNKPNNLYLHADGDSFFVACELTTQPHLRGLPVIVGGDRGIAVAMSAEAKALGVTRGMPVFKIKRLYPQVVILSHHFDLYRDISHKMHEILLSYFQEVEVYSIDECFALVQPYEVAFFKNELQMMTELKNEIQKKLSVTYSLGLARTKALAKQASKLQKPNGLVMLLTPDDEMRALKATSIDDIWGIGWRTVPAMQRLGFKTAYDFAHASFERLAHKFSQPLLTLQRELRGEQIMEVESHSDPRDQRSIQSTSTFHPTSSDAKVIRREIAENTEHACANAREIHLFSNKVSFFVKTTEFKYVTDEVKLEMYTSDPGIILTAIEPKLKKMLGVKRKIRATGITLHNLVRQEMVPKDLFGLQDKVLKNLVVEEMADKIRAKYGNNAIKRAGSLRKNSPPYTPGAAFKKGIQKK